jgi:predicted acetyltransferase
MTNITLETMRLDEAEAVGLLLAQSLHFNLPDGNIVPWMERRGLETFRVARLDGKLAAALNIIDMAQWFGGQAIATAGISAVGVAPEYRGRKIGAALMLAMLREVREQGVALSTLYPATTQFYRSVGYERAGARTIYTIPTSAFRGISSQCSLVPAPDADSEVYAPIHAAYAQTQPGNLRRPSIMWDRILKPIFSSHFRYLVLDAAGRAAGYIVYAQGNQKEDIKVADWCALTPDAARALLQFLGGHRTLVDKVQIPGAPNEPLLHLLPEQHRDISWQLDWMLRLIDVPQALQARGYPAGIAAELHLDISDQNFDWNHGRFVLRIAEGAATVEPGGTGQISLHVRDLAALYSGHLTPAELQLGGALSGPPAQLAALGLAFSGSRPWMADMF